MNNVESNMTEAFLPEALVNVPPEDLELVRAQIDANFDDAAEDPTLLFGLKALGTEQETVDGLIELGAQFLRQGLLDRAFEYFSGLVQLEPLDYRVHHLLGAANHRRKFYDVALASYRIAVALKDEDSLSHLYLGECLIHLGQKAAGVEEVKRAHALMANDVKLNAHRLRAQKILAAQEK